MQISVLIVAHNEEKYIKECIKSVLNQTRPPDEVVVLVHNSTDKTLEIAKSFPVTVVPFDGARGIVSARLEVLNHISGEIILCIDGDSFASNNWVEAMVDTLKSNNNVLVSSWVKFKGAIFGTLYNIYSKHLKVSSKRKVAFWMWGASLAFWGKDKEIVKEIIKNSVLLSNKLNLTSSLEDYWLAMFMNRRGNIEVTNKTYITTSTKNTSSLTMIFREKKDRKTKRLINEYFQQEV